MEIFKDQNGNALICTECDEVVMCDGKFYPPEKIPHHLNLQVEEMRNNHQVDEQICFVCRFNLQESLPYEATTHRVDCATPEPAPREAKAQETQGGSD